MEGGVALPHSGIVLEEIFVENKVDRLFFSNGPIADLTVRNTDFADSTLLICGYERYRDEEFVGLVYPECAITLESCKTAAGTVTINRPATATVTKK